MPKYVAPPKYSRFVMIWMPKYASIAVCVPKPLKSSLVPESVTEMNIAIASQMSIAPMIAPRVNRTIRRSPTHAPTV